MSLSTRVQMLSPGFTEPLSERFARIFSVSVMARLTCVTQRAAVVVARCTNQLWRLHRRAQVNLVPSAQPSAHHISELRHPTPQLAG